MEDGSNPFALRLSKGESSFDKLRTNGILITALVITAGCARHDGAPSVSYAEARAVIDRHCVACHSDRPTLSAFPIAPGGVELDSADQMQRYAARIKARTVDDKSMPLLNKSGMTGMEREILARWIAAGAQGPASR